MRFQLLAVTRWYWTGQRRRRSVLRSRQILILIFRIWLLPTRRWRGSVLQPGRMCLGIWSIRAGVLTGSDQVAMYGSGRLAGDWPGDLRVAGSWTLQADQAIGGSLYLSSGTLDVGGFSLTVAGGVYQAGGDFNAHSGAVTVGGDVVVSPYGVFSVGGGAVDVAGGLTVGGTARLQMTDAAGYWMYPVM